jgi:hypothetical protein
MNQDDYRTTLLIDAAAAGDDRHLPDYRPDAFCEAALTGTLTDCTHQ